MGISMRVFKAFLVVSVGLFVVITLFSLLIPSRVKVSRAVVINGVTTDQVYRQIAELQNWKNWQPMFMTDSATINFTGKGCDITYKGKLTRFEITGKDSLSMHFILKTAGESNIDNEIRLSMLPGQNALQAEWQAITKLHWYPWEKFYAIFIDKISGPGYEEALNNLKTYLERGH